MVATHDWQLMIATCYATILIENKLLYAQVVVIQEYVCLYNVHVYAFVWYVYVLNACWMYVCNVRINHMSSAVINIWKEYYWS